MTTPLFLLAGKLRGTGRSRTIAREAFPAELAALPAKR
jgi:hypothetical protein